MAKRAKKAKKKVTQAQLQKRIDVKTKQIAKLTAQIAKLTGEIDVLAADLAALVAAAVVVAPVGVGQQAP